MSDSVKLDENVNDTQDTFFENPDDVKDTSANASLHESQDFNLLLDTEAEDQLKDSFTQQNKTKSVDQSLENDIISNDKTSELEKNADEIKVDKVESTEKNIESEKEEEDEEFIAGTPPNCASVCSSNSLKRKLESENVCATKVARTNATSDASKAQNLMDEEEDMFVADSLNEMAEDMADEEVIPETQESNWSESVEVENKSMTKDENQIDDKTKDKSNEVSKTEETKEEETKTNGNEQMTNEEVEVDLENNQVESKVDDEKVEMNESKVEDEKVEENSDCKEAEVEKSKKENLSLNSANEAEKEKVKVNDDNNDSEMKNEQMKITESAKDDVKVTLQNGTNECEVLKDEEEKQNDVKNEEKMEEMEKMEVECEEEEKKSESNMETELNAKNRFSIEVIYDKKVATKDATKSPDVIELLTDDDKDNSNVIDNKFSDTDPEIVDILNANKVTTSTDDTVINNVPIVSIGDSDCEEVAAANSSLTNAKSGDEAQTMANQNQKVIQIEREIGIFVKLKCLLNVDESTKDLLQKEVLSVNCEASSRLNVSGPRVVHDTSASLADISGNETSNKDNTSCPSSNQQMLSLPPSSRYSSISTSSSSSCPSSAAALAAKMIAKDNAQFLFPRSVVPRTKPTKQGEQNAKLGAESQDGSLKDWKNAQLLTTTVLNFATIELTNSLHSSNAPIDSMDLSANSPTPNVQLSTSTPDSKNSLSSKNTLILENPSTPRSSRKRRQASKRPRSTKTTKSALKANGYNMKVSPEVVQHSSDEMSCETPSKLAKLTANDSLATSISYESDEQDEIIGKQVFAKWSDNNYYPGTVTEKVKLKYKVHFYDGKSKVLIEDFVIPVKNNLKEGMSVYANKSDRDFDCSGIIVKIREVKAKSAEQSVLYTIELDDDAEQIEVPIMNISLTQDQAQVLRDELQVKPKSAPSTPSTHVTLDNMVEGKRRSKRTLTGTPSSTYASKKSLLIKSDNEKPSVSGVTPIKKYYSSEWSSGPNVDEKPLSYIDGVQSEIDGTPKEYLTKKTNSRSKSKAKRKLETPKEDATLIQTLGPIPPAGANFFAGMSFVLTCANVESIDRYLQKDTENSSENYATDNEEEWLKRPFVRERLKQQLVSAGGLVYDDVEDIAPEDYDNARLITNVPNCTAKSVLCLSLGIKALNHNWVIRCCRENKRVNMDQEELPAGWSLDKRAYVESYQRQSNKPLESLTIAIPSMKQHNNFYQFWSKVCKNAGANVINIEDEETNFVEATAVLATAQCPSAIVEKASKKWEIPILSTVWVVQCLIEGYPCPFDTQPSYIHTYVRP